jgi:hypothetical protein
VRQLSIFIIRDDHLFVVSFLVVSGTGAYLVFYWYNYVSLEQFFLWYLSSRLSDHKDVYSYNFPEDKRFLKLLGMQTSPWFHLPQLLTIFTVVCAIFILETVQTALNCADLFYWFASGYGDITHLVSPSLSFFDGPFIESMVALIVQIFYAYRIWVLSNKRSWWFCLLICLVS